VDAKAEAIYPTKLAARVELELRGSEVRTAIATDAHGTPADPCSDSERRERFLRLGASALPHEALTGILDVIERLDTLPSVRLLSDALRTNRKEKP
jgi:hypothetical protein